MIQENRKYIRVSLNKRLKGLLVLKEINKAPINKNIGYVEICNISAGGINFNSQLKLNLINTAFYEFNLLLNGETFNLETSLLRCTENENGTYNYGAVFNIDKQLRCKLIEAIFHLSIYQDADMTESTLFDYYDSGINVSNLEDANLINKAI